MKSEDMQSQDTLDPQTLVFAPAAPKMIWGDNGNEYFLFKLLLLRMYFYVTRRKAS